MYSMFVKFSNGEKFTMGNLSEVAVRGMMKNGFKGIVSYANIITPSGVKIDITNLLINR